MAKKDWVRIIEERNRLKPAVPPAQPTQPTQPTAEVQPVEPGKVTAAHRRTRMLEEAERQGHTVETIAMLSLVRTVDGFTNPGAVYAVPTRAQIDGEFVRGAKTEGQARARVWKRLREQQKSLDYTMPRERGGQYARPSDWIRLFSALVKATRPEGGPNVFAVQSAAERVAFRKWAEPFGLNGDGLVHAAQTLREMYEAETGEKFQPEKVIPKIQAFSEHQLDTIIRAGFGPEDTYVEHDQGYLPISKLGARFDPTQSRLRDRTIKENAQRFIQALPPGDASTGTVDLQSQQWTRAIREYDSQHFSAVYPDRNSVAFELGIVGGVFAQVKTEGDHLTGFGYHGIIQPEVLKVVPEEVVVTERSKPVVRSSDGKTVVRIDRWLGSKEGIQLMNEEEVVASPDTQTLEQAATRKIADAIVYDKHEKVPDWVAYPQYIQKPHYWNQVHWAYKNLLEKRLPFLARVAGVGLKPIVQFSAEDAEQEWMHARILATGVTADKQLDQLRERFILKLEDVYPEGPERQALEQANKFYPETVNLARSPFRVDYVWGADGYKGIIHVYNQASENNAYILKYASPTEIPRLGTAEHPVAIIFRYEARQGPFVDQQDYPAERFRELLERIEPQAQMIESRWYDFERSEEGRLRIPLTITTQDTFPTPEQLTFLQAPHPESVIFCTDRDGQDHRAYMTLWYVKGDQYDMGYVKDQATAEAYLQEARQKHTERQLAAKTRADLGGELLDQRLAPVRELERQMNTYTQEYENDNLVAFVLGRPPFSEDDQDRLRQALEENNYERAQLTLQSAISERKMNQGLVDSMRTVSAVVTQLIALGFDWQHFNVNKRNRAGFEDEEYGGYRGRPDTQGFFAGDVRVYNSEVYLPSMGRQLGRRLDRFRLTSALPDLQRRLEYELQIWKQKKDKLKAEREKIGSEATSGPSPEVIHRGIEVDDEEES